MPRFAAKVFGGLFLLSLALASPSPAQVQGGNLYGRVLDEQGRPLPGATLLLSGPGAPGSAASDALGQFRFLGLAPGRYTLEARLTGFSPFRYADLILAVGHNTTIEVTLTGAVTELLRVTAASPLLDERRVVTGATLTGTQLEKVPTARDPWALLSQVPGVLLDRVNVGGNESNRQASFVGPGSAANQAVWTVDGVTLTDLAQTGSSPTYYDFDSFAEVQVTTGGADAALPTGGVNLNLVTKRGTDLWRGSGRYVVDRGAWQSGLDFDRDKLGQAGPWNKGYAQPQIHRADRIDRYLDDGVEGGGPLWKDRLWFWGAWSETLVDRRTLYDYQDDSHVGTGNAKLNAQLSSANSGVLFFLRGERLQRGQGVSPTRPPETSYDASGPTDLYKIEDTHIVSPTLFLTGLLARTSSGFNLVPEGGLSVNPSFDESFVWHNSFLEFKTDRPQQQAKLDGSRFWNSGKIAHELKFGAGYRKADVQSLSRWAGSGFQLDFYRSYGYPYNVLALSRDGFSNFSVKTTAAYLQDTLSRGNLTANLGLRYDLQTGRDNPHGIRANPAFPDLLPAISAPGRSIGFDWRSIAPRLGLTYALGKERKTLLHGSYARFADQLDSGAANWLDPFYPGAYVYVYYDDKNGDGQAQPGEIVDPPLRYSQNYDPAHPGIPLTSRAVDPNLRPPKTDEILLGLDHSPLPDLVLGLTLTWRRLSDLLERQLLVFDGDAFAPENLGSVGRVHRRDDYVPVTLTGVLPNGETYTQTIYQLRPGITSRGGSLLVNGDREQIYKGLTLSFDKRLSHRFMANGFLHLQDWRWKVPEHSIVDPTPYLGTGNYDGAPVVFGSATGLGPKGGVYLNSRWSYSLSGLYQLAPDRPWGVNVALNVAGHQGNPLIYFGRNFQSAKNVQSYFEVTREDRFRLDDVHMVNARLEKDIPFRRFGLTVDLDVFNLLNSAYVLQRQIRLGIGRNPSDPLAPGSDHVTEVTSPRIFRLGFRLRFR
jgi:carboxypeptidase family protein/TonB-dependent receptor-like protein